MRALVFALLLFPFAAQAGELKVSCKRYPSDCSGTEECNAIAEALRQDKNKEVLKSPKLETVHYVIGDTRATASIDDEASGIKYTPEFKFVTREGNNVILENKLDTGAAKERVIIDKKLGFYAKYMLHTDGSMQDVPVGEPYSAYFGWCTQTKSPQ